MEMRAVEGERLGERAMRIEAAVAELALEIDGIGLRGVGDLREGADRSGKLERVLMEAPHERKADGTAGIGRIEVKRGNVDARRGAGDAVAVDESAVAEPDMIDLGIAPPPFRLGEPAQKVPIRFVPARGLGDHQGVI